MSPARAPVEDPATATGAARTSRARSEPRPDPLAGSRAVAAAPRREPAVAEAVRIVAWISIAAGLIHAIAAVDHFTHYWLYGAFFLVLTYGQVLWGVVLLRTPAADRRLAIGAVANLAIVAIWVLSRTLGVPFGPEAGRPEPIGSTDLAATLDELVLAAYVAAIVRPHLRERPGFRQLAGRHRVRIGMALCSASVFAALLGAGHAH